MQLTNNNFHWETDRECVEREAIVWWDISRERRENCAGRSFTHSLCVCTEYIWSNGIIEWWNDEWNSPKTANRNTMQMHTRVHRTSLIIITTNLRFTVVLCFSKWNVCRLVRAAKRWNVQLASYTMTYVCVLTEYVASGIWPWFGFAIPHSLDCALCSRREEKTAFDWLLPPLGLRLVIMRGSERQRQRKSHEFLSSHVRQRAC